MLQIIQLNCKPFSKCKKYNEATEKKIYTMEKLNASFTKNTILIFFLFWSTLFLSQEGKQFDPELDSIFEIMTQKYNSDLDATLNISKILLKKAREKNNPIYESKAYVMFDVINRDKSEYNKLLQSTAITIAHARQYHLINSEIKGMANKSWAEARLGLLSNAQTTLNEGEELISKLKFVEDADFNTTGSFYVAYLNFYSVLNDIKSAIKMQKKAISFFQKVKNNNKRNSKLTDCYLNLGGLFKDAQQYDSAYYYTKKTQDLLLLSKFPNKKTEATVLGNLAGIMMEQKIYKEAIPLLSKSLEISDKYQYNGIILYALENLNICFTKINNHSNPYYDQYKKFTKKYKEKNNLTFFEKMQFQLKDNYYIRNYGFFIIFLVLTTAIIIVYKKNQKTKKIAIQLFVQQKENEKITEIIDNQKITLEEIIEVAKNNESTFLIHFSEYKAPFYNQLCTDYPELSDTQKKIIAFTYLYFTSKDIANIMNNSLRTIQNHKYNIRKILQMDKNINFVNGIQKLEKEMNQEQKK